MWQAKVDLLAEFGVFLSTEAGYYADLRNGSWTKLTLIPGFARTGSERRAFGFGNTVTRTLGLEPAVNFAGAN
jgi:hypothetical protein